MISRKEKLVKAIVKRIMLREPFISIEDIVYVVENKLNGIEFKGNALVDIVARYV